MTRRSEKEAASPYPRTARVNALLLQVLADELERLGDLDERLRMLTVTGVVVAPDLATARVYLGSIGEGVAEALEENRRRLQHAVGRQVRMRRTPHLTFLADPAIASGARVEELLRRFHRGAGD